MGKEIRWAIKNKTLGRCAKHGILQRIGKSIKESNYLGWKLFSLTTHKVFLDMAEIDYQRIFHDGYV